jgi:hypothetical protein
LERSVWACASKACPVVSLLFASEMSRPTLALKLPKACVKVNPPIGVARGGDLLGRDRRRDAQRLARRESVVGEQGCTGLAILIDAGCKLIVNAIGHTFGERVKLGLVAGDQRVARV